MFEGCDPDGRPAAIIDPALRYIDSISDAILLNSLRISYDFEGRILLRDYAELRRDVLAQYRRPYNLTTRAEFAAQFPGAIVKRSNRIF